MILNKENAVVGYVFNSQGHYNKKHYLNGDIDNITNFLMNYSDYNCAVCDLADNLILTTSCGGFIDQCPDQKLLVDTVLPSIVPKQNYEVPIEKIEYHPDYIEQEQSMSWD